MQQFELCTTTHYLLAFMFAALMAFEHGKPIARERNLIANE